MSERILKKFKARHHIAKVFLDKIEENLNRIIEKGSEENYDECLEMLEIFLKKMIDEAEKIDKNPMPFYS
jgi:hypothetical protein